MAVNPLSDDELVRQHDKVIYEGVAEGVAIGLGISLPGSFLLNRRWAYYRSLPLSLKALGVVIVTVPALVIQTERKSLAFTRARWTGQGKEELDRLAVAAKHKWESMTFKQRTLDWAVNHQYSLIIGGWALTMATAGAIISRRPYESAGQKLVQARVWAQGSTIALIIGAGILTNSKRKEAMEIRHARKNTDHSWLDMIEEQEREAAAAKTQKTQITS